MNVNHLVVFWWMREKKMGKISDWPVLPLACPLYRWRRVVQQAFPLGQNPSLPHTQPHLATVQFVFILYLIKDKT